MEDAPVLPRTNRSVLDAYQNDALGEMDLLERELTLRLQAIRYEQFFEFCELRSYG